jgi:hypothetical protein
MAADTAAGPRAPVAVAAAPDPIAAFCDTFALAQLVAEGLAGHGFEPAQLSVVGSGQDLPAARTLDERLRRWGGRGSLWGALGGLAVGAVLIVPPVGSVIAMGPIVTLLISALEGAMLGGGLSAIVATLTALGLPLEAAQSCEDAVAQRRFLVFVHGPAAEVARARTLVAGMGLAGVRGA